MNILPEWQIIITNKEYIVKTKVIRKVAVLFVMLLLVGCANKDHSIGFQDDSKIAIVTTIYPVYDFACNIAGDKAEIINLVPAGVEPHDFELSTGDMQLIESADIFLYNGAGMEHFVDKTLQAVTNDELIVVECAKDVTLLEADHSHDDGENHDDEKHTDPHTWLSVANAIVEAEAIKNALVDFDPENAQYYEDNFADYKEKLMQLHEMYQAELKDLSGDTIVVAHEAFGYLCEEYDLHQEGIEGLTADSEPDSARMKEIIDFCKSNQIKVIFFEELVSPKVAETVASEIGAETMVLNPIEGLTAEQETQGLDYIALMKQNLEVLKKALQ